MYAQTALPLFDQGNGSAVSTFGKSRETRGFGEPARRGGYDMACSIRGQRFVRSVATDAGLGSFAYIQGGSGKRYVFSAVRGQQVSLYNKAVFALAGEDGGLERIVTRQELTECGPAACLYVHLLEDEMSAEAVIADMRN